MSDNTTARLQVAPTPAWVEHAPYDTNPAADSIQDGICLLLRETQVNIAEPPQAACHRIAYQIATQAGAERGAQFSATFDPQLQRMTVHYIRVIRNEAVADHASVGDFELMRRETNLERRVLDGRLTASLIIPDVRSGDIIESCWTVWSDNPVLRDFYSDWIAFDGPTPDIRSSLRAPVQRLIVTRTFGEPPEYEEREQDGIVDRRWRVRDAARYEIEQLTPPWQILARSVQISEERTWSDVSCLFEPHYHGGMAPPEIRAAAEEIMKRHPRDAAARMLGTLELVREKLRYLSLSFGEGGFIPRSLEQIWMTGYGDCKDAARLFVALCRLVEVDAACALVATRYGPVLNGWLPSPSIFDHCIARVRLGDKSYWIDPTRRARETSIEQLFNQHLGWALPLQEKDAALEYMGLPPPRLLFDKIEKLSFGRKVGASATLDLSMTYHSLHADRMRDAIANQGLGKVARHFENGYRSNWPTVNEALPMRVEDDLEANKLCLHASYTINTPWTKIKEIANCSIPAGEIATELARLPPKSERKHDIHLGVPRILRRRLEVQMPRKWNIINSDGTYQTQGLKFLKNLFSPQDNLIVQEQDLTISLPSCSPEAAKEYREIVEELTERAGLTLRVPFSGDRFVGRRGQGWRTGWTITWIILLMLFLLIKLMATSP